LIWDKALGDWTGGHTDALDPNLWQVIMATVGFYFLYEGAVNTARILKGVMFQSYDIEARQEKVRKDKRIISLATNGRKEDPYHQQA
jgi:hypothetical protein